MNDSLIIRPADSWLLRRRFIDLPYRLHRDNPCWVPPLRSAQAKLFARRTAFFEHAEMALFLAFRGRRAVGRVAAIHNFAHNAKHKDQVGFFGFFECEPQDTEAAAALFSHAEKWLADRGLKAIRGPVNPSMNSECGLLVEGFDSPPYILMPYNPPEYVSLIESCGFRKVKDLLAFPLRLEDVLPGTEARDRLDRTVELIRRRRPDVSLRCLNTKNLWEEIRRFMSVFEEARRNNWGHVDITPAELREAASELRRVIDPELVIVAEVKGEIVGGCFAVPNINPALKAAGGRLLPLGFIRLMRAMRRLKEVRVFAIGVIEKYRLTGITPLLLYEVMCRGMKRGYVRGEASWTLEDNVLAIRNLTQIMNLKPYKVYRMYEKPISEGTEAQSAPHQMREATE